MRFPDSHFPVKVLAASLCGKITDQRKPVFWHILRSEHGLFCPELLDILEKSMQFWDGNRISQTVYYVQNKLNNADYVVMVKLRHL